MHWKRREEVERETDVDAAQAKRETVSAAAATGESRMVAAKKGRNETSFRCCNELCQGKGGGSEKEKEEGKNDAGKKEG